MKYSYSNSYQAFINNDFLNPFAKAFLFDEICFVSKLYILKQNSYYIIQVIVTKYILVIVKNSIQVIVTSFFFLEGRRVSNSLNKVCDQ